MSAVSAAFFDEGVGRVGAVIAGAAPTTSLRRGRGAHRRPRPAEAWTWAHQLHLQTGNRLGALRCAFWLVFRLLDAGDLPSASGWIARIEWLLCDAADDSPEVGYLTYLTGFQAILSRDLQTAAVDLGRSVQIAEGCGDLDLSTLAQLALGRVRIFRGDVSGGVRLLDEVMVAVNAGGLRRSWSATATAPPSTRAMTCSTYVAARYGHPDHAKAVRLSPTVTPPLWPAAMPYVPPPDLKNAMCHTPHARRKYSRRPDRSGGMYPFRWV